jgi:hypothetical protein
LAERSNMAHTKATGSMWSNVDARMLTPENPKLRQQGGVNPYLPLTELSVGLCGAHESPHLTILGRYTRGRSEGAKFAIKIIARGAATPTTLDM